MESQFIKKLKNYEKDLNDEVKDFLCKVAKDGQLLNNNYSELDGTCALLTNFSYLNRIIVLLGNDLVYRFIGDIQTEDDIENDNERQVFERSNILIRFGQLLKKYEYQWNPEIKIRFENGLDELEKILKQNSIFYIKKTN